MTTFDAVFFTIVVALVASLCLEALVSSYSLKRKNLRKVQDSRQDPDDISRCIDNLKRLVVIEEAKDNLIREIAAELTQIKVEFEIVKLEEQNAALLDELTAEKQAEFKQRRKDLFDQAVTLLGVINSLQE